jgi:hypothetical protein
MSWSIACIAASKAAAKRIVSADQHLPNLVRALIIDAVGHIEGADDKPISIVGNGHQADGRGSYSVTTCTLEVKPLTLLQG